MRAILMVIFSVLILAILNYGIYEKEQLKTNGETVLLELAPVDPRSLMQGDYMRLRYAIEREASKASEKDLAKRGYMVIHTNDAGVAQFQRFYDGNPLKADEKLLRFYKQNRFVRIIPASFFFQEGHAKYYETAKYGVFIFDTSGNHILAGLADEDQKVITVP